MEADAQRLRGKQRNSDLFYLSRIGISQFFVPIDGTTPGGGYRGGATNPTDLTTRLGRLEGRPSVRSPHVVFLFPNTIATTAIHPTFPHQREAIPEDPAVNESPTTALSTGWVFSSESSVFFVGGNRLSVDLDCVR